MPLPPLPQPPADFSAVSPVALMGIGLLLVCAGQRLFWFFVGAVGFLAAMWLARQFFHAEEANTILHISLAAGVAGAALAVFVQKIAVSIAGAATGAYLTHHVLALQGGPSPTWSWIAVGVAAIAGAFLMAVLFKWTLVFVTALAGTHLLLGEIPLPRFWLAAAYAAVFLTGIFIQGFWRRKPEPD